MKIETKLNKGDVIYFLHEKKCINSIVQGMLIYVKSDGIDIVYLCNTEADKNVNIKVNEVYAFPTKKDLLASL